MIVVNNDIAPLTISLYDGRQPFDGYCQTVTNNKQRGLFRIIAT